MNNNSNEIYFIPQGTANNFICNTYNLFTKVL